MPSHAPKTTAGGIKDTTIPPMSKGMIGLSLCQTLLDKYCTESQLSNNRQWTNAYGRMQLVLPHILQPCRIGQDCIVSSSIALLWCKTCSTCVPLPIVVTQAMLCNRGASDNTRVLNSQGCLPSPQCEVRSLALTASC